MYECFNSVKKTGKAKEMLQKNVIFFQNKLNRKAEIIKTLLETQTLIIEAASKTSLEEANKKRKHHQQ